MSKIKESIMSKSNVIPPEFDAPGDYYAAMEEMTYYAAVQRAAEMMMMYGKPQFYKAVEQRYRALEAELHGWH